MAPDSDDDPDLRARVEQLEATVEQQQATIQQLLPSRRRVLQAGGLVAGGGVLGALSADRASADVVGQVGTQQDRVDVFAGAVDANSVSTGSATIDGKTGDGTPASSTDQSSLGFGTWRTPSSNRPVSVSVRATAETDGTNDALVRFVVDEDGGTAEDYFVTIARADPGLGSGGEQRNNLFFIIPPGASYKVRNVFDPTENNVIFHIREFER